MVLDRRQFLGAAAGAAVVPRAMAQTQDRLAELYRAAQREGEVTWYVAQIDSAAAERVGKHFGERFPGVRANVIRATGQVIYQRLNQDMRAKVANCDVLGSTDLGHYIALRRANQLLRYEPLNLADCLPIFRDYDPEHYISITGANCTSLVFNSKLVSSAEAPMRWQDLLDPKWAGQIAVAHPGFSGAMGAWVVEMQRRFGWDYFKALAANKPLVARSLVEPPTTIAAGERKIGLGPSNLIINLKMRGNPLDISYPADGVILQVAPTSILTTAPHPNAAKLFMEYLLSKPVGEELAEDHGIPFRNDVEARDGVAPISSLKLIRPNAEELEKEIPEVIEKWRDTFGV